MPPPVAEEPAYRPAPPMRPPQPAPPPEAPQAPAAPAPASAQASTGLTQAGLPRRVPRANLAPGMTTAQEPAGQADPPVGRSPDEVRSMLSSYRTGIERGRTVAGGGEAGERPPDAS
jgi:hypothetical protein